MLIKNPELLENKLKQIPKEPGIYLMKDDQDQILYIGKSNKLRNRVRSYFQIDSNHSPRIAMMVRLVADIEYIITDTPMEALALEANLIKQHQPHFNVLLKDDKRYPYVCITWSQDYPRIFITRNRQLKQKGDRYYGPYTDATQLRQTLYLIKKLFPLRQRPQPLFPDRPCLNYYINRCPGVCQSLISYDDYRQTVEKVAMIFQGRTSQLINNLTQQMELAANELNFELAAQIRDQIQTLQNLTINQKVSLPDDTISRDAIALATNHHQASIQLFQIRAGKLVARLAFMAKIELGDDSEKGAILQKVLEEHYQIVDPVEIPSEILVQYPLPELDLLMGLLSEKKAKKVNILIPQRQGKAELIEMVAKNALHELNRIEQESDRQQQALEDLAQLLDLEVRPHRIEGYDISHIQGTFAVGSQVVFIDGIPAKQYYRHYNIKNPNIKIGHSDDFASLQEVITRRFNPDKDRGDFPDLIMIDGGKGQLSSVVEVLQKLDLLDRVRVISLAKQREEIFLPNESFPILADPEQPGVQLLRRLRDEAHRFAITFHRHKRSLQMKHSRLEEIPGLGFHRQKILLAHFHSIDYIQQATLEQLKKVAGIGPKLAQEIYNFFH